MAVFNNQITPIVLGWIAFALSLTYVVIAFMRIRRKRLCLLLSLLASLFMWRVSYLTMVHTFSWPELFENFVESIKNFAVDTPYKQFYVNTFHVMEKMHFHKWFANIWIFCMYFAAPVTSAITILDMVSNLFEKIRLFFVPKIFFWKEVYYFSELNEQSIALAQSARNSEKIIKKPIVVFADAYLDDENERSSELYYSAKSLGAICLKDDILHLKMRTILKRNIVLIDTDEQKNVQCMMSLVEGAKHDKRKKKTLSKAEIVVCADSMTYSIVIDKIKQVANNLFKDKNNSIFFVNVYSNMVKNLFKEMPLYEPLVGGDKNKELNLTIVGAGQIGTELFLSVYWCGQMLGHKLNINVVSKEPESSFVDKINFINPEIMATAERRIRIDEDNNNPMRRIFSELTDDEIGGRTKEYAKIMKKYPHKEECTEPYFTFRYYQTDIGDDDLAHKLKESHWLDGFKLCDTDYFAVAIGADAANIQVSDKLNKYINEYKLAQKEDCITQKTVVACAVYNSALSRTINENQDKQVKNLKTFVYAFGSFEDVFSLENMQMKSERETGKRMQNNYDRCKSGFEKGELEAEAESKTYKKTEYDFWANIARAIHLRYKAYSAGFINNSVFTVAEYEAEDKTKSLLERRNDTYTAAFEKYEDAVSDDNDENGVVSKLTWLEHRRWCAFTRVRGFTRPEDFKKYFSYTGQHKEMELKLHPFLVESDIDNYGQNIFEKDESELDCLDRVNREISDYHLELSKKLITDIQNAEDEYRKCYEGKAKSVCKKTVEALKERLDGYIDKITVYNKSFDRPLKELKNENKKQVNNCIGLFVRKQCPECHNNVSLFYNSKEKWAECTGCGKRTASFEFCYDALLDWDNNGGY